MGSAHSDKKTWTDPSLNPTCCPEEARLIRLQDFVLCMCVVMSKYVSQSF